MEIVPTPWLPSFVNLPTKQNQYSDVKVGSSNGDDGGGGASENVSPSVSLIATVRPLARLLARSLSPLQIDHHLAIPGYGEQATCTIKCFKDNVPHRRPY